MAQMALYSYLCLFSLGVALFGLFLRRGLLSYVVCWQVLINTLLLFSLLMAKGLDNDAGKVFAYFLMLSNGLSLFMTLVLMIYFLKNEKLTVMDEL